ncbi:hypothetical protein BMF94_2794 [Rhodotorula taiwanensis]|uniref:Uncharacterized protein n=1 Tax=Rhodotorula taiwanensis TaxID=741276 RepID=A0A2S5BB46_9BASI|nr:hypothetical protein BMF94_2794 [Rhodotorula taiwanensis]
MSSKALPYQVSAFANTGDRYGQLGAEAAAFAQRGQTGPAFRSDASSSHALIEPTDAFKAFAQGSASASPWPSGAASSRDQDEAGWRRAASAAAVAASERSQIHSGFPAATSDGSALSALLDGEQLTDAVDGEWEHDLRHREAGARATAVPSDPLARRSPRTATPNQDRGQYGSGDMSPTSRSLLSSLATLSLAEQTYLRTLLASQDPAQMFEDYFSHGSYTDDVWSVDAQDDKPAFVRDVLDRAAEKGKEKERTDVDGGRAKAVRRLEMVLRHLNGKASFSEGVAAGERGASTSTWVQEAAVAAASRSEQQARTNAETRSLSTTYAPSSLSSSAFVSFATSHHSSPPRPVATPTSEPVANSTSQAYSQRPAAPVLNRTQSSASSQHSDDSVSTDSSYEEYAREKEARMRSNEGGRFGPDFTRRFVSAENEVRFGVDAQGGQGTGSGGGPDTEEVSEERTH